MKYALFLSALVLTISGYSQPSAQGSAHKDTSVSCIANWKLGETKIYTIVREKISPGPDGKVDPITFVYEAWISVIDSSAKNYTIKWVFHLPESATLLQPALADSSVVYNGMKMIFRTTEMGAFIELLNWEEVRDGYARMMELSLSKTVDSTRAAMIQSTKAMFNSREMVESTLIKEIQLFHVPFGYKFKTNAKGVGTEIENPFGGKPFPAIQTSLVSGIDPKEDAFTLAFNLRVDEVNTKGMIDSVLKKMNIKEDQLKQQTKEKYSSFDIHDFSEYRFINSTGWIRRLYYKRTVLMSGMTQTDAFTITLKE